MRQGFEWPDSEPLEIVDSTGLPALRYALIYVESRGQIDSLQRMGVYFSELPIFASDRERYRGKCGVVDNSGDLQGLFVYALLPGRGARMVRKTPPARFRFAPTRRGG